MKLRIILSLLIVLALASGCAKDQITASAIDDLPIEKQIEIEAKVTSVEACMNVECGSNSKCVDGKCVCNEGYKKCNGECILNDDCCTENDCGARESCRDHKCIPDNCKVNEKYDSEKNKCVCDADSKYCATQHKCIPKKNCCMHAECDSDYRCTETNYLVTICISGEDKKQCKSVYDDRGEAFFIDAERFDVEIVEVLQGDAVDLKINDIMVPVVGDTLEKLDEKVFAYIEKIEPIGGYCKRE